MTEYRTIARYYSLGRDVNVPGELPALTRRAYAPSLEYARAAGVFITDTEDDLTTLTNGIHLTPDGRPNEAGSIIRYPRYVIVILMGGTDAQQQEVVDTIQAQYASLSGIGGRVLISRGSFPFEYNLSIGTPFNPDDYEGGELYVANVYLDDGSFPSNAYFPYLTYGTPAFTGGTWYSDEIYPDAPTSPTSYPEQIPPGTSIIASQTYAATTTSTYFPGGIPTTYTEFRTTAVAVVQRDAYIAQRQTALAAHGDRFKKFVVCDYLADRPVRQNAEQSNTTDGSFPGTPSTLLASQVSVFASANPSPWSRYRSIASPSDAGQQIVTESSTFFTT